MFAPVVAGVMRAVIAWAVFAGFKMLVRSLNRVIAEPVKPQRISRASARILVEEEKPWGEPEITQSQQAGAPTDPK